MRFLLLTSIIIVSSKTNIAGVNLQKHYSQIVFLLFDFFSIGIKKVILNSGKIRKSLQE